MMVGYPVSGHPLDGLEDFVISKSKNISKVQDWFEKLKNPEAVTTEDLEKTPENKENLEKNTENKTEDSASNTE